MLQPYNLLNLQVENLRCFVVGRIRTLHTVDGQAVTQEEASEAIRSVVSSHLTMAALLNHAHIDVTPLPSLSMMPIAQAFAEQQPRPVPRPVNINSSPSSDWCDKVGEAIKVHGWAGTQAPHCTCR